MSAAFLLVGILCAVAFLAAVVWLASIPGRIARDRRHPQADAIAVCGYLGMLFLLPWLVALVWAFTDGRDRSRLRDSGAPTPATGQTCSLCSARIERPYAAVIGDPVRCPKCGALSSIS